MSILTNSFLSFVSNFIRTCISNQDFGLIEIPVFKKKKKNFKTKFKKKTCISINNQILCFFLFGISSLIFLQYMIFFIIFLHLDFNFNFDLVTNFECFRSKFPRLL